MIRNISLYVKDILQNMGDAEEFIQGLSYDGFVADKRTFNAVVRSLEVIGERRSGSLSRIVSRP